MTDTTTDRGIPLAKTAGSLRWTLNETDRFTLTANKPGANTEDWVLDGSFGSEIRAAMRVSHFRLSARREAVAGDFILHGGRVSSELWSGTAVDAQDSHALASLLCAVVDHYELIATETSSLLMILDTRGHFLRVNRAMAELLGTPESAYLGTNAMRLLLDDESVKAVKSQVLEPLGARKSWASERTIRTPLGPRVLRFINRLVSEGPLEDWYIVCSGHDATDAKIAELGLVEGERFLRDVLENLTTKVLIKTEDSRYLYVNAAARDMMIKAPTEDSVVEDLYFSADADNVRKADRALLKKGKELSFEGSIQVRGEERFVQMRKSLLRQPDGTRVILTTVNDVTEVRKGRDALVHQAMHDALTGLPNRYAIQTCISDAIAAPEVTKFGVIFIDIDDFKRVNDSFGHTAGDQLICTVASVIQGCLRETDTLARLGGDEFIILVRGNVTNARLAALSRRILRELVQPVTVGSVKAHTSCSLGIAIYPQHGTSLTELVQNADTAMYAAKEAGKGVHRVFTPEMNAKVNEHLWLDVNLRSAVKNGELRLHYQPKVNLKTGAVESVEALIRWDSKERGMISPDAFIPYAEQTGLVVPLGKWVLHEAARQARAWLDQGLKLRVAINVSARQLHESKLVHEVATALCKYKLHPATLDVELTESWLVADEEAATQCMAELRELGVQVHLDDFGTGYSSLSQLARLPIDVVKMDRSFITNLENDRRSAALVRSMAVVAAELGMKVVAEGIETQEQADFLNNLGVDYGQGFHFARPMPAEALVEWLAARQNLASAPGR